MKNKLFINRSYNYEDKQQKQNCACSLPTPPAALHQVAARSRNGQQEPWASAQISSEDIPLLWAFWRPIIKGECKTRVRTGTEQSPKGHLLEG